MFSELLLVKRWMIMFYISSLVFSLVAIASSSSADVSKAPVAEYLFDNSVEMEISIADVDEARIESVIGSAPHGAVFIYLADQKAAEWEKLTGENVMKEYSFSVCGIEITQGIQIQSALYSPAVVVGASEDDMSLAVNVLEGRTQCSSLN